MTRIPTEALIGPESLQNLQLQDNLIGKCKLLFLASIVVNIYSDLSYQTQNYSLNTL